MVNEKMINEELTVVKIGGNIINNKELLNAFLLDFSNLKGKKILVHGGGKMATTLSHRLKIETKIIGGRRITSAESLDVAIMVYAGLINKNIVAKLQGQQTNAIGLSGADANCIAAHKREVKTIDFGWVGDVDYINTKSIDIFIKNQLTPVFCAITHDNQGQLFNTNADTIAAEIAVGMSQLYSTTLIYCFEKNGVLRDVENENSVIPIVNKENYKSLKAANIIHEGMIPKIDNCFMALERNVAKVIIGNSTIIRDKKQVFTSIVNEE